MVGNNTSDANTPRAPSGPERIEAGTARVPLRAGWERMLCEGEGPNSVQVPSLMLQVFCGMTPGGSKSEKIERQREQPINLKLQQSAERANKGAKR